MVTGLRHTNWQLQNCVRDVKYNLGNIVNNIVTSMNGAGWVPVLLEESLHKLCKCLTIVLYT